MQRPTDESWQRTREKLRNWRNGPIYLPRDWPAPGVIVTIRESRRRRLQRWITAAIVIAATAIAYLTYMGQARAVEGATGLCSPRDPDSCVYLLERGERAPFTGHLITYRRAAELVVAWDNCHAVAGLRVAEEQAICRAKLARSAADRRSLAEAHLRQLDVLQRRLEAVAEPVPWWRRAGPVLTAAVVGALTGAAGAAYLLR